MACPTCRDGGSPPRVIRKPAPVRPLPQTGTKPLKSSEAAKIRIMKLRYVPK